MLRGYQPTGMAELLATVGRVAAVCVGKGWPGRCARATVVCGEGVAGQECPGYGCVCVCVCVWAKGWFRVGSDDSEIAADAGEGIDGEFEL